MPHQRSLLRLLLDRLLKLRQLHAELLMMFCEFRPPGLQIKLRKKCMEVWPVRADRHRDFPCIQRAIQILFVIPASRQKIPVSGLTPKLSQLLQDRNREARLPGGNLSFTQCKQRLNPDLRSEPL